MSVQARAGIVNFINTSPIYVPWQELPPLAGWQLMEGPPTLLNRLLRQGELDAGLISSFAYGFDSDRYYLLPDLSISATGPVGSVILLSRRPVDELNGQLVLLTSHSATSANLLKIILEDFYRVQPLYKTGGFSEWDGMDPAPQAYLAIGDEALRLRSLRTDLLQLDLAKVWLTETGLPFVFAVWAVRRDSWERDPEGIRRLHRRLVECHEKGSRELERISRLVAHRIPMDPYECLAYLKGIDLGLSQESQQGLRSFFSALYRRGALIAVRDLAFPPLEARPELSLGNA
jgi:chorismate dehydratase